MPGHVLHPDHRDQPERRLECRDAAKRGRADHRTGRLRAESDRHHAGGNGGSRSRRRAARRMGKIARIACRRWHQRGELRRHRFADDDAAGLARQHHRAGIGRRAVAGINRRAVLRRQIGGGENIFKGNRQAAQRQSRKPRIVGGAARPGEVECNEGADLLFACVNGFSAQFDRGARGQIAGFDTAGKIEGGEHHLHLIMRARSGRRSPSSPAVHRETRSSRLSRRSASR